MIPRTSPRVSSGTTVAALLLAALLVAGCDERLIPTAPTQVQACGGYTPQEASPYLLPYPVGQSYEVLQGNCTGLSHYGDQRYAYDILMPIGTVVTAIAAGVVVNVRESFADGDMTTIGGNVVAIDHGDGTYASYVHLTQNGALVEVGDLVAAGQPIALSGRSGGLGIDPPHLHLELLACNVDFSRCQTLPLTFRNASPPAPNGLQRGVTYTALP